MLVTLENAEQVLMEKSEECHNMGGEYKSVHLEMSKLEQLSNGYDLNNLCIAINSLILDKDSNVIVCQDSDIFIITKFINQNMTNKLEVTLSELMDISKDIRFAKLYEINHDWDSLVEVIKSKLAQADDTVAEKKPTLSSDDILHLNNKMRILNKSVSKILIEQLETKRKNRSSIEILLIEDDLFSTTLIKRAIQKEYNVSSAEDGEKGILKYFITAADIMFLDIELPDINGHEILAKILKHDPNAFIVMLSGNGNKENIMKAMNSGAKGFIAKPFTKDKLDLYVQKALNHSKLRR